MDSENRSGKWGSACEMKVKTLCLAQNSLEALQGDAMMVFIRMDTDMVLRFVKKE